MYGEGRRCKEGEEVYGEGRRCKEREGGRGGIVRRGEEV